VKLRKITIPGTIGKDCLTSLWFVAI